VKRFFYILILLLIVFRVGAQRVKVNNLTTFDNKRIHFGFTLGLNETDFDFSYYQVMKDNSKFLLSDNSLDSPLRDKAVRADISTLVPGFTVGIVSNLRLTESFDLRFLPGMSFGERRLVYNIPVHDLNSDNTAYYSIKSTFLDFPLLLKYKARRMNNQRPYLIAGLAYRVDISKTGVEDLVRTKPFSSYVETGVGWDTYLEFFRLSTELKFSFGLNNVLDVGPKGNQSQVYTDALQQLTSNIFTLSFHFE
jgi:hypothetical protein